MEKFIIILLIAVFVTLISSSVQSVVADHLEPGIGIFSDEQEVTLVPTKDTNYQVYLQAVLRNGDNQLISIIESNVNGAYIPHKISDHVFDTLMGKKEIVTIDNIKYEKVQYTFIPTLEHRWTGFYPIFSELLVEFEYEEGIIAKMNTKIKDYSIWNIHYCGELEGHGYQCIPVFQALVPTMTLEPTDVVTHHWTILRDLN